jgi:Aminopeptidase P, N-terminal domain
MRVPTLFVALAVCSSAPAAAGPPAAGPDWFASHRAALAAKLPPDAIAVFRPGASEGKRYTLFVKPKNWAVERWTGRRAGVEGAAAFRVDAVYPIADFQKESRPLLAGTKAL